MTQFHFFLIYFYSILNLEIGSFESIITLAYFDVLSLCWCVFVFAAFYNTCNLHSTYFHHSSDILTLLCIDADQWSSYVELSQLLLYRLEYSLRQSIIAGMCDVQYQSYIVRRILYDVIVWIVCDVCVFVCAYWYACLDIWFVHQH